MALVDCPSCNKKTSDKAKTCPHCDFKIGDATSEDIERKQSLQRFKKLASIQNQSLLAMLIFVASFGFMYWGGVVGFVWYLVNRARIVYIKRFS